jgi:hypothetical protein
LHNHIETPSDTALPVYTRELQRPTKFYEKISR